jgi:hypothetical protein
VRAYIDRNKNLGIDPSEPWDSASVSLTDSATATLLVFAHDTVPPRIRDVSELDSVSLRVSFDRPVDPAQTLTAANFAVIGPDSAPVPIAGVGVPLRDSTARPVVNSAVAAPRPAAPAVAPPRDTTVAAKPAMPRPSPLSEIGIKLQRPLARKTTYRIRAVGIRGLLGHTGDSERPLTTPAPPPPAVPKPAVTPSATPTSPPVKQ